MIVLVGCDDVEVVVDLTNVLLGASEEIGPLMKVCAAAVIVRAAVAAPTNRRDPYMLLISAKQFLPGDEVSKREWYRLNGGGRKKRSAKQ